MGVPTVPLTDLYNRAGDYIRARGGEIRLPHLARNIFGRGAFARAVVAAKISSANSRGEAEEEFDYLVLALPFEALERVLPESPEASPLREQITHFESSPITGIHLWFDRQITDLDHAVLLDRTIQWMFHKSRLLTMRGAAANTDSSGSYIELVVSASKSLIEKSRAGNRRSCPQRSPRIFSRRTRRQSWSSPP